MNNPISAASFIFSIVFFVVSATAADAPYFSTETLRSAPRSEKAVDLPRQLSDVGHMMPMMEIAMISRLCKSAEFQTQIGKARSDCSKAVFQVKQACTKAFHDKFPRADDAEVDGRLSFQKFSAGYMQCLKDQYFGLATSKLN